MRGVGVMGRIKTVESYIKTREMVRQNREYIRETEKHLRELTSTGKVSLTEEQIHIAVEPMITFNKGLEEELLEFENSFEVSDEDLK
jgi:hypothetical protein